MNFFVEDVKFVIYSQFRRCKSDFSVYNFKQQKEHLTVFKVKPHYPMLIIMSLFLILHVFQMDYKESHTYILIRGQSIRLVNNKDPVTSGQLFKHMQIGLTEYTPEVEPASQRINFYIYIYLLSRITYTFPVSTSICRDRDSSSFH